MMETTTTCHGAETTTTFYILGRGRTFPYRSEAANQRSAAACLVSTRGSNSLTSRPKRAEQAEIEKDSIADLLGQTPLAAIGSCAIVSPGGARRV